MSNFSSGVDVVSGFSSGGDVWEQVGANLDFEKNDTLSLFYDVSQNKNFCHEKELTRDKNFDLDGNRLSGIFCTPAGPENPVFNGCKISHNLEMHPNRDGSRLSG